MWSCVGGERCVMEWVVVDGWGGQMGRMALGGWLGEDGIGWGAWEDGGG